MKAMKIVRHTWNPYGKRDRKCPKCLTVRTWDFSRESDIFYDRFGKLHLTIPDCVLPNTKL
jgi:hypothetical protein